jgi:hypothetical protein
MDLDFSLPGKSNDTYPQHHEKVSILAEIVQSSKIHVKNKPHSHHTLLVNSVILACLCITSYLFKILDVIKSESYPAG